MIIDEIDDIINDIVDVVDDIVDVVDEFEVEPQQENSATKDIVEAAIECLMRDEDHTKNLLARRGGEIRQPNVSNEIERMVRIARTLGPPTNLPNTSQSFNNPEECAILPTSCVKEESTCLLKKT